jgi:hypothetical protein
VLIATGGYAFLSGGVTLRSLDELALAHVPFVMAVVLVVGAASFMAAGVVTFFRSSPK